MKIRGLTRYYHGWEWNVVYEEDDWSDGTHSYSTNVYGEGLWKDCKQILGTCQHNMRGCTTYSGAYSHVKRLMTD